MEKTNPLRWKLFGLLCALLLCLGGLPVTAQNCPSFQWSDFTTTLVQPNKDCNKPGIATIRYSNNIVGVDEGHYQFRPMFLRDRRGSSRCYGESGSAGLDGRKLPLRAHHHQVWHQYALRLVDHGKCLLAELRNDPTERHHHAHR